MKIMCSVVLMSFYLVINGSYAAGIADNITVYQVRIDQSGMGYIWFTSPLTGIPASCASSHPSQLSFDTNTAGGKAILSLALSAKVSGKRIYAKGTDSCEGYNVVERLSTGYLKD